MAVDETGYREYVVHRLDGLRRVAYLLCGDWHTADDLVSVALIKLLRHWPRVSAMEQPDAYVRRMLLRAWLDERRRPWRREHATEVLPDRPAEPTDAVGRLAILAQLAELPPRRRAVVVLRYFCDLSVEDTAEALGWSPGTAKEHLAGTTGRALRGRSGRLITLSSSALRT